MTQNYENVSAMVDGEAVDENFTRSIVNDPVLKAKWQSYHLTRDLLRNDMSSDVSFDISSKVAEALEDELDIIAPKPTWRDYPVVSAIIPVVRQSGQLAMVACVTAMVIFGYQTYNQPDITQPFTTAPPALGPQGGLAPVNLQSSPGNSQASLDQLLEQRAQISAQISALVEDHRAQQKLKNVTQGAAQSASEGQQATNENTPDENNQPQEK